MLKSASVPKAFEPPFERAESYVEDLFADIERHPERGTLRIGGQLRGCCGTLEAVLPLAEDVARSAFQAAFRDPRFDPIGEHELSVVRLEVSVLSPLETIAASAEADLAERLVPGTDGLVIFADGRRATFLPTVWEMFPEPQQFLAALRKKCGLPADYWSEQLRFQRYRTTSFAEPGDSIGH